MKNFFVSIAVIISSWFGVHNQIPSSQIQPTNQPVQVQASQGVQSNITANTHNDNAQYYTYTNQKDGFSVSLPVGWGVMDTDGSGNQISGLDSFPSAMKQISQKDESKALTSATEIIQVSTITPPNGSLKNVWTKLFSSNTDANVSNPSSIIKSIKVRSGKVGEIDNCTGYEYQIFSLMKIYSFTGCAVNSTQVNQVKGYLDKMVQTLQEI